MKMLKKVNTLMLGLAVLLAFGCGKDDNQNNPVPANAAQKNCLQTKRITAQGTSEYLYNSAGKLERFNYIASGTGSNFHQEFKYNAAGNVSEVKTFDNNNVHDYLETYTYNANNLPETITNFYQGATGPENLGYQQYHYNAAKQVIKISSHNWPDTTTTQYNLFSYPAPDQVISRYFYKVANGTFQLTTTYHSYYDDKRSLGTSFGYIYQSILYSKHNVIRSIAMDHNSGATTVFNFTYTYNPEGYPVQQITTSTGQPTRIENFEYSCL